MYVKFDTYCYLKQTQNKINSIASKSLQNITIFSQSVLVAVAVSVLKSTFDIPVIITFIKIFYFCQN
jgi:hypothetical protein